MGGELLKQFILTNKKQDKEINLSSSSFLDSQYAGRYCAYKIQ